MTTPVALRLQLRLRGEHGEPRLDALLVERLRAELAATDATLVTIEGENGVFCDGMPLDDAVNAAPVSIAARLRGFAALLDAIATAPRPVIALVDGPALGGGLGLCAAADVVLATPRATFGLPETLFGVLPAMVLPVIARRVGAARARWLAVGALTIPADDALRFGLVDEISDDLEAALARYARRFERLDARALAEVKLIAAALQPAPAGYYDDAVQRFERLAGSDETRARIARFAAGEAPWPDAPLP